MARTIYNRSSHGVYRSRWGTEILRKRLRVLPDEFIGEGADPDPGQDRLPLVIINGVVQQLRSPDVLINAQGTVVYAAAVFAEDNTLLRADGPDFGIQRSGLRVTDLDQLAWPLNNVLMGDDLTGATVTAGGGQGNVLLGPSAGATLGGGDDNLYLGNFAGALTFDGNDNIGLGNFALALVSDSSDSIGIGQNAGRAITSGGEVIFIGLNAGNTGQTPTASNAIGIGRGVIAETNQIVIGNSSHTETLLQGLVGINITPESRLHTAGNTASESETIIQRSVSNANPPRYRFRKSRGSVGLETDVANGDVLGAYVFTAFINGAYQNVVGPASAFQQIRAHDIASPSVPAGFEWGCIDVGNTTNRRNMMLSGRGDLGIFRTQNPTMPSLLPTGGGSPSFVIDQAASAPSGFSANTAGVYSLDVSGVSELHAWNDAAEHFQLTGVIFVSGTALTIGRATVTQTTLRGDVVIEDGEDIILGTTTGTKIATAVGQKLGFWGKAPITQPTDALQAALTNSTGGSQDGTLAAVTDTSASDQSGPINDNFTDVHTLLNEIRDALVDSGIMKGS